MKLPVSWLKKVVDWSGTPEKLAEILTMSGTAIERVETKNGEPVLVVEVTTNRPDCLSILGLAQEVYALTGKKVRVPSEYSKKVLTVPKFLDFSVTIEDKKACPFYTGLLLGNVQVQDAPADARKVIELAGARPINNAVDATNYVLFESGQPLHAFDFDKLDGAKIVVRFAKKGEKMTGIDGNEYTLDDKTLVIADASKPVAIAGVIGGKVTEVTPSTKRILLESAYFDPRLVRQAAKKYKITTESGYRFERGVNPANVLGASNRAASLLSDWAGAKPVGKTVVAGSPKLPPAKGGSASGGKKTIKLRAERVERILGASIPMARISALLKRLSFDVKPAGKDSLSVAISPSRRDVTQEADLVEEILRLEGFDKIPVSVPITRHSFTATADPRAVRIYELKKFMAAAGFQEIVTYSLLSQKVVNDSASFCPAKPHKVANAVSQEQAYFRPSLLPGVLGAIAFNVNRKASSLKFFEIGNRYVGGREETALSLGLYGRVEDNWKRKSEASVYDLKGALEAAAVHLGAALPDATIVALDDPAVLAAWNVPQAVYLAEAVLEDALSKVPKTERVKPVAKFPSVRRDIAFIVKDGVTVAELEASMRQTGAPHLKEATLFDEYKGRNIGAGRRSLAFSLAYQKEDGTFTDDEITGLQKRVGEALKTGFGVEFR